jgi:hypothetical protein
MPEIKSSQVTAATMDPPKRAWESNPSAFVFETIEVTRHCAPDTHHHRGECFTVEEPIRDQAGTGNVRALPIKLHRRSDDGTRTRNSHLTGEVTRSYAPDGHHHCETACSVVKDRRDQVRPRYRANPQFEVAPASAPPAVVITMHYQGCREQVLSLGDP